MFTPGSNAFKSYDMLMRDATNATNTFQIASKDMINWHNTFVHTMNYTFHELMLPEHICPNISVPRRNLRDLKMQIEKVSFPIDDSISYNLLLDLVFVLQIRECRQEKFEQLNVLKGIADTMSSLNKTETLEQLKDTIEHLNKTAHVEDIELKKEEDELMALNVTIQSYACDCTYNSWGDWGSCSKTCGEDGIKSRSRDVRWNATNSDSRMKKRGITEILRQGKHGEQ